MRSPWADLKVRPYSSKKKGREIAAQMSLPKELCPRLLCGRRRLTEVRGAIDLLARVGHRDLRALREVHVRVAALDDAADQRDRHTGLDRLRTPPELLDQLLRATELRRPAGVFPAIADVEDDEGVRVHHDELHDGPLQRDRLFVVAPCITVMGPCETGNQGCDGQRYRAQETLLHGDDTSH